MILDRALSVLLYVDSAQRCRIANRACLQWFGIGPEGLEGLPLATLMGPDHYEADLPRLTAALEGSPQSFERDVIAHNGDLRSTVVTLHPDLTDGRTVGLLIEINDVTRLKNAESALRAQLSVRERAMEVLRSNKLALREAQRVGSVGSWEWDIDSDLVTWTDQLYRIFGRDPSRPPPSYSEHAILYVPEDWLRLQIAVAHSRKTGQPYSLELQFCRPDAKRGWLDARGEAVLDDTGRVVKLRGTATDITVRREAQENQFRQLLREQADRGQSLALAKLSNDMRPILVAIQAAAEHLQAGALTRSDTGTSEAYRTVAQKIAVLSAGLMIESEPARHTAGLSPAQLRRAKQMLSEQLSVGVNVHVVAGACDLSPAHFTRAFKASTGSPPHRWVIERRIEKAKGMMRDTDLSLSEIAVRCGFSDQSHLTRTFSATVGESPAAWRRMFKP